MTPYYQTKSARLYLGDALDVLSSFEPDSIDALVCDPPAGISFMGKTWDGDHGGRAGWVAAMGKIFAECLRVLKPGAHGLVWALPRTSHWTACALEDAGFEVRDCLQHLFGSGFPKSLDVSKALDKGAGIWRGRAGAITIETQAAKGTEYERTPKGDPVTTAAAAWQGWGTALKPAVECWWLVRKPFRSTVVENVLAFGTGALNVDACRVGMSDEDAAFIIKTARPNTAGQTHVSAVQNVPEARTVNVHPAGRWPANLLLSHHADCTEDTCAEGCPVRALDEQSGELETHGGGHRNPNPRGFTSGIKERRAIGPGDSGGASRFFPQFAGVPWFYTAKASRGEREDGLDHLAGRSGAEAVERKEGSAGLNNPRAGAGRTASTVRNHHPCVKPTSLMSWLVRLITPPKGTVLDCFMGSGSTAVAATHEGFSFIGIERETDYAEIAAHRLRDAVGPLFAKRPGAP